MDCFRLVLHVFRKEGYRAEHMYFRIMPTARFPNLRYIISVQNL